MFKLNRLENRGRCWGEYSPKSPVDPTGEEDKDKNKNDDGKPEDEKHDESSDSKGRRKTRMMMMTRNQVVMICYIENGRHGRRSKK